MRPMYSSLHKLPYPIALNLLLLDLLWYTGPFHCIPSILDTPSLSASYRFKAFAWFIQSAWLLLISNTTLCQIKTQITSGWQCRPNKSNWHQFSNFCILGANWALHSLAHHSVWRRMYLKFWICRLYHPAKIFELFCYLFCLLYPVDYMRETLGFVPVFVSLHHRGLFGFLNTVNICRSELRGRMFICPCYPHVVKMSTQDY